MLAATAILAAALSRAEIIERFRAAPITGAQGLVQVVAECPADMRKEFQGPVAGMAIDMCTKLYASLRMKPSRFERPGITVVLGDVRTNLTDVVTRRVSRADGTKATRILLPAPGYADLDEFRLEVARAFFLSVKGEDIGRDEARMAIIATDPRLKADYAHAQIENWLAGRPVDGDDEAMLKMCRSVVMPGTAHPSDVLRFASRLFLYPEAYDRPFCGRYRSCSFHDAVDLAEADPRIRFFALVKAPQVAAFGAGRSEPLIEAAKLYSDALVELGRGKLPKERLHAMFDEADAKLNVALEDAMKTEENGK
jgi:hypothetical protein